MGWLAGDRLADLVLPRTPQFTRYLPAIYPLAADLIARDTSPEIREGLRDYFVRVGYAQGIIEPS